MIVHPLLQRKELTKRVTMTRKGVNFSCGLADSRKEDILKKECSSL